VVRELDCTAILLGTILTACPDRMVLIDSRSLFDNSRMDASDRLPGSLVSYPYVKIRAFGTDCGRKSRNHMSGLPLDFHDPKACPESPVTAMMLKISSVLHNPCAARGTTHSAAVFWRGSANGVRPKKSSSTVNRLASSPILRLMAISSSLSAGGTRKVAVATQNRSARPETAAGVNDHPSKLR
jgi:hypothetical protein